MPIHCLVVALQSPVSSSQWHRWVRVYTWSHAPKLIDELHVLPALTLEWFLWSLEREGWDGWCGGGREVDDVLAVGFVEGDVLFCFDTSWFLFMAESTQTAGGIVLTGIPRNMKKLRQWMHIECVLNLNVSPPIWIFWTHLLSYSKFLLISRAIV